jgi:hypothetical protein
MYNKSQEFEIFSIKLMKSAKMHSTDPALSYALNMTSPADPDIFKSIVFQDQKKIMLQIYIYMLFPIKYNIYNI